MVRAICLPCCILRAWMMRVRVLLRSKVYVNGLHSAVTEGELIGRGEGGGG